MNKQSIALLLAMMVAAAAAFEYDPSWDIDSDFESDSDSDSDDDDDYDSDDDDNKQIGKPNNEHENKQDEDSDDDDDDDDDSDSDDDEVFDVKTEEGCIRAFKKIAQPYRLPGDVSGFFDLVEDDEEMFNGRYGPDLNLSEAVEQMGAPEYGCIQFAKFYRQNKANLDCMKDVVKEEEDYPSDTIKEMRDDWSSDQLFKAMIVCYNYI